MLLARVAEWQTRRTQNPLSGRACGFESHLGHPGDSYTDWYGSTYSPEAAVFGFSASEGVAEGIARRKGPNVAFG